jgi:hypothetical protein
VLDRVRDWATARVRVWGIVVVVLGCGMDGCEGEKVGDEVRNVKWSRAGLRVGLNSGEIGFM